MEHFENQLDMFEESSKKQTKQAQIAPLRKVLTIRDVGGDPTLAPRPFTVIRMSPTTVCILNEG